MRKEFEELTIHQKMVILAQEMVDKELHLKDSLREFERVFLLIASRKYRGNTTRMAKALGIHRNTLHNRVKLLKVK